MLEKVFNNMRIIKNIQLSIFLKENHFNYSFKDAVKLPV